MYRVGNWVIGFDFIHNVVVPEALIEAAGSSHQNKVWTVHSSGQHPHSLQDA
jgi:hypothetical protein